MSSPPFNWTRSSRSDQCTSLLAGGSATVVPLSLLLSPSKPNRATNRQAHNLRGTCSKLRAAQLGPSQLWLRPPPQAFLPECSKSFQASKRLYRLFPYPGMFSSHSSLSVIIFCFFFSLGDPHKMPPHPGSPLGRARRAFSWDMQ